MGVPKFKILRRSLNRNILLSIDSWSLLCIFLVLGPVAVFYQVRDYDFVSFDDLEYVVENVWIASGSMLGRFQWAITSAYSANWHPLTWMSHALDIEFFGLSAGKHHLINVLFHIANALLLFLALKRMTGCRWRGGLVAALFAFHPLNVETVAWISQRKSLLSTFFMMLIFWFYSRYAQHGQRKDYGLAFLCFILGLLAKPMIVTIPFVLLLLDYWPLRRFRTGNGRRIDAKEGGAENLSGLIVEKLPFFAMAVVVCFVAVWAQRSAGAVASLSFIPIGDRLANAVVSYAGYLYHLIWPFDLAVYYPYPDPIVAWKVGTSLLLLCMVSGVAYKQSRHAPWLMVGWLWYLGTLVPVIGLVQVGSQAMADRYAYVPMIGVFIMVAWMVPDSAFRHFPWRFFIVITVVLVMTSLMMTTWRQTRYWQNSVTLFHRMIEVAPKSAMGHYNLAVALEGKGRVSGALNHYREALRLNRNHVEARMNYGLMLSRLGNYAAAIHHYLIALKVGPENFEIYNNLGAAYADNGDLDLAVKHFMKAIQLKPEDAKIHNNLGVVLLRKGKSKEAMFHLRHAVRIDPEFEEARRNMAIALRRLSENGQSKR
jgi:Flp pilus assembly protein TadD